jgi:hypothetical protein
VFRASRKSKRVEITFVSTVTRGYTTQQRAMASKRRSVVDSGQRRRDIEKHSDSIFYSARYSGGLLVHGPPVLY